MANISRRQFLKGAGVATLAVAAAGMMAGCSKEDIPQVPEVTTDIVTVYFFDKTLDNGKGGGVGDTYKMEVLKGDPLDPTKIPAEAFPKGYVLESEAPVKVEDDGNGKKLALVPVKVYKEESKPASKSKVFVTLKFFNGGVADRHVEVIANKVFDLKSNPNEMVSYADIKDSLLAQCKDIEPDETWQSYLKIVDGGYEATVWMGVALKG